VHWRLKNFLDDKLVLSESREITENIDVLLTNEASPNSSSPLSCAPSPLPAEAVAMQVEGCTSHGADRAATAPKFNVTVM
jgi:hypothetical protein